MCAVQLSNSTGNYPRATQLPTGRILVCFDTVLPSQQKALKIAISEDDGRTFYDFGLVTRENFRNDLGSAYPIATAGQSVLVGFRNHGPSEGEVYAYRLICCSSSNGGASWIYSNEIEPNQLTNPTWEPFFLKNRADTLLHVYYAYELLPGGDQQIRMRQGALSGSQWEDSKVVASQPGNRFGMPSVTRLQDGTLFAVFESWQKARPAAPYFCIRSIESYDDGITWINQKDLYLPGDTNNAGAPFAVTLPDGRIAVSFMSDVDILPKQWPSKANAQMMLSRQTKLSEHLDWEHPRQIVDEPSIWPSLFVTKNGKLIVLYGKNGNVYSKDIDVI